jgi:serine/threonine-protein kinase
LEPNFALAYAGLSHMYSHSAAFKLFSAGETKTHAKEYALKAIELDDNLAESHAALAHVYFINEWDMDNAHRSINKALSLSPGTAELHSLLCMLYSVQGQLDEALLEATLAMSLDPLSPMSSYVLGTVFLCRERFTDAIEQYDKTLKQMPYFQPAQTLKAKCHIHAGEVDKAIDIFSNIQVSPTGSITHWGALGATFIRMGDKEKGYECLRQLQEQESAGMTEFHNWDYTLIYEALDDLDKMYHYLEKALDEKNAWLLFIRVDPHFKKYIKDKRFIQLMKKTFGNAVNKKY